MPAPSPRISPKLEKTLRELGQRLRVRRKDLSISAIATAEAAGMSRVTLHRIERGEPSVAMGAYLSAIAALGFKLELADSRRKSGPAIHARKLPTKIRLAEFSQLKRLAWQLKDSKEITPEEALDLYERNWRHVDLKKLDSCEKELLETLLEAFGRKRLLV